MNNEKQQRVILQLLVTVQHQERHNSSAIGVTSFTQINFAASFTFEFTKYNARIACGFIVLSTFVIDENKSICQSTHSNTAVLMMIKMRYRKSGGERTSPHMSSDNAKCLLIVGPCTIGDVYVNKERVNVY